MKVIAPLSVQVMYFITMNDILLELNNIIE